MKYLFVVAHPDDEVLGAGGLIYNLVQRHNDVYLCIMCADASARRTSSNQISIRQQTINCANSLGIPENNISFGSFPNIEMNTIPHLELVRFIEGTILDFCPDVVVTHYKNDLNNDHKITSECCDEAIRLFQRKDSVKEIKKYMYMEVLSSTDWINNDSFSPNYFYEINKDGLDAKIKALSCYDNALREYPHSRSKETIEALATLRGSQAKLNYAEGFIIAFERDKNE